MASRLFRPVVDWVIRYRAEIAQFGWPLVALESFNYCFDHLFYPFAIAMWGQVTGGIIPTITAFALNIALFWLYEVMEIDWLRAKVVRELVDKKNKTRLERLLTWHRTKQTSVQSRIKLAMGFMVLTLAIDPVILAIYYRENYFKGISIRDWGILLIATASACFLWVVFWEIGVIAARYLYHLIYVALLG
jgi:hypothetical protein